MHAIVTTTQDIQRIVASAVQEGIAKAFPDLLRRATQKSYLTKEEVQDLTGWSVRTLQNLRSSGQLPFVKHGSKILYPCEALYAFLDGASVQARKAARLNPSAGEGQR